LGTSSAFWKMILVPSLIGYVAFSVCIGRFLGMDEVFFKSAGREWAQSGRFASPELTGLKFLQDVDPPIEDVWFVHPPAYPFLFGVFIKWVGFGPWQCVLFDALIHAFLALLTFLTARKLSRDLPDGWCLGIALAVLPIGYFCRPDELALCLGMLAVLMVLHESLHWPHVVLSGILIGLSAAASAGAAVVTGLIALTLLAFGCRSVGRSVHFSYVWGLSALISLGLALAPILVSHPGAYRQYFAHAADHVGRGNFLVSFFTNWETEQFHRSISLACLSLAFVSLFCAGSILPWKRWVRLWLAPLIGIGVLAVFLPDKVYYLWFLGPWMMAAGAATGRTIRLNLPPLVLKATTVWVIAFYAIAIAPFLKNVFIMVSLPESQSLETNARIIREIIPGGSTVLTDDYWWVLAPDCRVYDRYFSRPAPETLDYIILMGNGSGDSHVVGAIPEDLAGYVAEHFRPIHNNINTEPLCLLGKAIPNTAYGFGTMVLQRYGHESNLPVLSVSRRAPR